MPILASNKTCTGCGGCSNICPHEAISLQPDSLGFLMPEVDKDKCVECKLCEKACPIVNDKKSQLKYSTPEIAYAMWSTPDRSLSSSGGAFSAIARPILNQGGRVYGAAWKDGFNCCHQCVDSINDLQKLRGSKYLQSSILDNYKKVKQDLNAGKKVLFTGTPCQVAGLRSFLIKPYENLLTVDIVCHGVPSQKLFSNYITKLKTEYKKFSKASGFTFRNLRGWGISPALNILRDKVFLYGESNLYMTAFDRAAIFRNSCYDCQFNGLTRVGDLTIADFWGIGKQGIPFKHDVTEGVSLMLANSEAGKKYIETLQNIFIEQRPLKEAIKFNKNLIESSPSYDRHDEIITDFLNPTMTLSDISKKYSLMDKSIASQVKLLLIRTHLLYPIKSLYNKIRTII